MINKWIHIIREIQHGGGFPMINNSGDNTLRGCGQGRRDSDRPREGGRERERERERERDRERETHRETAVVPCNIILQYIRRYFRISYGFYMNL